MNLSGRTVLVTGAARGIGREFTRQLAQEGCRIVAVGRDAAALARLETDHPGQVTGWPADLTRATDVERLVREVPARHPDLSLLINNAGVQVLADFTGDDPAALQPALRDEIAVNFAAVVALCGGLLPLLRAQPWAAVVNVTSGLALAPKKTAPVYCATKAAVRSFTKALRYQCEDAAPHVRVVDAVMALVDTDMTAGRGTRKIGPERASAEVLAGIRRGDDEIYVERARLLRFVMRLAPGAGERLMRGS